MHCHMASLPLLVVCRYNLNVMICYHYITKFHPTASIFIDACYG